MKAKFTKAEKAFLRQYEIAESDVLDVRKHRPVEWKLQAKKLGYRYVLRDPRPTCLHRLSTRSNSCLVCNPASIRYQSRHTEQGCVYLVFSQAIGAVKVGCTCDIEDRLRQLNVHGYAGATDWTLCEQVHVAEKGRVEAAILAAIPGERIYEDYAHRFSGEKCREVFKTSLTDARSVFLRVVDEFHAAG